MITPLIVLFLLTLPLGIYRLFRLQDWQRLGGAHGLALAYLFFCLGHFIKTAGMLQMLPPWIPFAEWLVYLTGVLEGLIALGLLLPPWRKMAAMAALATLILFFPANIYAALHHTGLGGHQWGPVYLFIRAPLQLLLLYWAWYFCLRDRGRFGLKAPANTF